MLTSRFKRFTIQDSQSPAASAKLAGSFHVLALLFLTPQGTPAFWLRLVALVAMFGVQLVFWMFTQPVNNFWLQSTTLGSFGNTFFDVGSERQHLDPDDPDGWKRMRDRWEYSHIARAALATFSFLLLVVTAITKGH
jgi:hypothetical protein